VELRQQLLGPPKGQADENPLSAPVISSSRAQLETLLEQHRRQSSSLDSDAAASRDYRTMCIARTQFAEAMAFEQKLGNNPGSKVKLRLAS
jgi:hypothetical protein